MRNPDLVASFLEEYPWAIQRLKKQRLTSASSESPRSDQFSLRRLETASGRCCIRRAGDVLRKADRRISERSAPRQSRRGLCLQRAGGRDRAKRQADAGACFQATRERS